MQFRQRRFVSAVWEDIQGRFRAPRLGTDEDGESAEVTINSHEPGT